MMFIVPSLVNNEPRRAGPSLGVALCLGVALIGFLLTSTGHSDDLLLDVVAAPLSVGHMSSAPPLLPSSGLLPNQGSIGTMETISTEFISRRPPRRASRNRSWTSFGPLLSLFAVCAGALSVQLARRRTHSSAFFPTTGKMAPTTTRFPVELSPPTSTVPALYRLAAAQRIRLVAAFGGQGSLGYWSELRYLASQQAVRPFIVRTLMVLQEEAPLLGFDQEHWTAIFPGGYAVADWLASSQPPPPAVLALSPVSYPLIALCQFARFKLLASESGLGTEKFMTLFQETFGHSQGVAVAAAIGMSTTAAELDAHATQMCLYLLYHGVRSYQLFLTLQGSHPVPDGATPMMAVARLPLAAVADAVAAHNETVTAQRDRLEVVVINGSRLCVVGGLPHQLLAFKSTLEASKVKCRAVFLPISCPFHHSAMKPSVDQLLADIDRRGLLRFLTTRRPVRRVYGTVAGETLEPGSDLLVRFLEMQLSLPSDWLQCVQAVCNSATGASTPTYIVDFGPGGAKGLCGFTAPLLRHTPAHLIAATVSSDTIRLDAGYAPAEALRTPRAVVLRRVVRR